MNTASITYDSREILQRFAEAYKIDYPMLADVGSKVIRAFGILNTNVPEDHKMMYGMPWPGDYLIGPDGTVRDKLVLRNYEHRPSASQLILRNYGSGSGNNCVEIETDVLTATVSLSAVISAPPAPIRRIIPCRIEALVAASMILLPP